MNGPGLAASSGSTASEYERRDGQAERGDREEPTGDAQVAETDYPGQDSESAQAEADDRRCAADPADADQRGDGDDAAHDTEPGDPFTYFREQSTRDTVLFHNQVTLSVWTLLTSEATEDGAVVIWIIVIGWFVRGRGVQATGFVDSGQDRRLVLPVQLGGFRGGLA
jgi:hypothetical protein